MEYPQITALVPTGEHFDLSALNEGIWLTTGHIASIETRLAANSGTITLITGERDTANQALEAARTAANTAATQATNDLATANSTIATLRAEIATLKSGPAGSFTQTNAQNDPATEKNGTPFHASESNPFNLIADGLLGKPQPAKG